MDPMYPALIRSAATCRAMLHHGRAVAVLLLFGPLVLAPLAGCRTDAQDKTYHFDNPNDPHPDTGTGTGTGTGQLVIAMVNTDPDVVAIVNQGTEPTDLSTWTLTNDDLSKVYTFSGFTLAAGNYVLVFSATGTDTSVYLYTGSSDPNWGPVSPNNVARLRNDSGTTINTCQSGNICWN